MITTIIFDKKSPYWSMNGRTNEAFIKNQINCMYDRIRYNGYIYFSDIYNLLGVEWNPYDNNVCLIHGRNEFACTIEQVNGTDYKINIFYQV